MATKREQYEKLMQERRAAQNAEEIGDLGTLRVAEDPSVYAAGAQDARIAARLKESKGGGSAVGGGALGGAAASAPTVAALGRRLGTQGPAIEMPSDLVRRANSYRSFRSWATEIEQQHEGEGLKDREIDAMAQVPYTQEKYDTIKRVYEEWAGGLKGAPNRTDFFEEFLGKHRTISDPAAESYVNDMRGYVTAGERDTYNHLRTLGLADAAEDYLSAVERAVYRRRAAEQEAAKYDFYRNEGGVNVGKDALGVLESSASSLLTGFASIPAQIVQNVANLITGDHDAVDVNAPAFDAERNVAAVNRALVENAGDLWSAGGSGGRAVGEFAMETLLSVSSNVARMTSAVAVGVITGGGSVLAQAINMGFAFANSAGQTSYESLMKGNGNGNALTFGIVAGALECLTEFLPMEQLFKILDGGNVAKLTTKAGLRAVLKQAGVEASEEAVNELCAQIADVGINGYSSEFESVVRDGLAKGMAEDQAMAAAWLNVLKNVGRSAAAGAISGGVMGSGGILAKSALTKVSETKERKVGQDLQKDGFGDYVLKSVPDLSDTERAAVQNPVGLARFAAANEDVYQSFVAQKELQRNVADSGEAGRSALGTDPSAAEWSIYEDGRDGASTEDGYLQEKVKASGLSAERVYALYEAGAKDRNAVKQFTVSDSEVGLHFDGAAVKLNRTDARVLNELAKSFAVKLTVADMKENGKIQGDRITVNRALVRDGNYMPVVTHETAHRVRDLMSDESYRDLTRDFYQALEDVGAGAFADSAERAVVALKKDGKIASAQMADELFAYTLEAVGTRLTEDQQREVLKRLAGYQPTGWEKIKAVIAELLAKLRALVGRVQEADGLYQTVLQFADRMQEVAKNSQERKKNPADTVENTADAGVKEKTAEGGGVRFSYKGVDENGYEVYETSEEISHLSQKQRAKVFLDLIRQDYVGRTARFQKEDGSFEYASMDPKDARKLVYGSNISDRKGKYAFIKIGADGDVFTLFEQSAYQKTKIESGKHSEVSHWDYFVKTVFVDGIPYDVVINIKTVPNQYGGTDQYVYSVSLRENKNVPHTQVLSVSASTFKGALGYNNSIPENGENVKTQNSEKTVTRNSEAGVSAQIVGALDVSDAPDVASALFYATAPRAQMLSQDAAALQASINRGLPKSVHWNGIAASDLWNSSYVMKEQDLREHVGSLEGESPNGAEMRSIMRSILAVDSTTDWSWLNFRFEDTVKTQQDRAVRGMFRPNENLIRVSKNAKWNTVAHEMGHALDWKWGQDLFGNDGALSEREYVDTMLLKGDRGKFAMDFAEFIGQISERADTGNEHLDLYREIFARFVSCFCGWVEHQAMGAGTAFSIREFTGYRDRFEEQDYLAFARLLQEKAYLDVMGETVQGTKNPADAGGTVRYSQKLGGYFPEIALTQEDLDGIAAELGITDIKNLSEVQEKVYEKFKSTYISTENQPKAITNIDTGAVVYIYKNGIKETFGNKKWYRNRPDYEKKIKLSVMPRLAQMIKYGELIQEDQPDYHSPNSILKFTYLTYPITVDGEFYDVKMDVKVTPQGNRFHIHRILVQNKTSADKPIRSIPLNTTITPLSADNISISENGENVNTQNSENFVKRSSDAGIAAQIAASAETRKAVDGLADTVKGLTDGEIKRHVMQGLVALEKEYNVDRGTDTTDLYDRMEALLRQMRDDAAAGTYDTEKVLQTVAELTDEFLSDLARRENPNVTGFAAKVKGMRFGLDEKQAADVAYVFGSLKEARQALYPFCYLTTKGKVKIDALYDFLRKDFPDLPEWTGAAEALTVIRDRIKEEAYYVPWKALSDTDYFCLIV